MDHPALPQPGYTLNLYARHEVLGWMQYWGMTPSPTATQYEQDWTYQAVCDYLFILGQYKYFTQAVMFNHYVNQSQKVLICAVSTGETTNIQRDNERDILLGLRVEACYWCRFQVYLFRGLSLGNIKGMLEEQYQGNLMDFDLGEFILSMGRDLRMPDADARHMLGMNHTKEGTMIAALGQALARCGIPTWQWVDTGLSTREFRAIDLYCKYLSPAILDSSDDTAHWIVNAEKPWEQRPLKFAQDWWQFYVWESAGQRNNGFSMHADVERVKVVMMGDLREGIRLAQQRSLPPGMILQILENCRLIQPDLVDVPDFRQTMLNIGIAEKFMLIEQRERMARFLKVKSPVALPPIAGRL
jgi:hypothetical protein